MVSNGGSGVCGSVSRGSTVDGSAGGKVKLTLRFRGREMAHQQLGMDLLKRVQDDVAETAKVEALPRLEGRQMLMVLAPK